MRGQLLASPPRARWQLLGTGLSWDGHRAGGEHPAEPVQGGDTANLRRRPMGAARTRGPPASRSILQQRPTDLGKVVQKPEASKGSQDPIPAPAPVKKRSPGPALRRAQAAVAPPDGGDTSPCPPAQPRDTQAAARGRRMGQGTAPLSILPGRFAPKAWSRSTGTALRPAPTTHTLPRGAVILVPVPPAVPCPLPPQAGQRWHKAGDAAGAEPCPLHAQM